MRKLIALIALVILTWGLQAKKYDFKGFDSIDVSSIYEVNLTQSDSWSVNIECSDDLKDKILISLDGHTLELAVKNNTKTTNKSFLKANITMPDLKDIELSGACTLRCSGNFGSLDFESSGACGSDLDINAYKLDISVSGSSELEIRGKAKEIEIEGSGAVNIEFEDFIGKNIDLDLSGASNMKCKGNTEFAKAVVELSGASNAYLPVSEYLELDLSGASNLKYTAPSSIRIVKNRISGACKLSEK